MSGNCENPDDETALKVAEKLREIGSYVEQNLSDDKQAVKIFSTEYVGFFDSVKIVVKQLEKDGKNIDWLNVLKFLTRYENSIQLIIQLVLTIKQIRKVMTVDVDWKSHKERMDRIARSLQDIETKTKKYSEEVEELGKQWMEILKNDVEYEECLKAFDFAFDQLFIKIKSCTCSLLDVKKEIRKGSKDINEYLSEHDKMMTDVRKLGIGAVGVGVATCLSSSGDSEDTSNDDGSVDGSVDGGSSRTAFPWRLIFGGLSTIVGLIGIAGSYIGSWITKGTTAKIQTEYENLDFEADKLQQTLAQLTDTMENYKEHRSKYSN